MGQTPAVKTVNVLFPVDFRSLFKSQLIDQTVLILNIAWELAKPNLHFLKYPTKLTELHDHFALF